MQEWGLCIFCNEVHLSIIGYKKKKKTYWHVDDHRHIVNVSSDSKQRGRVVRTTWEYFIVEVAGKRQPNKVLLMGGGEGRGGRKSSWGSTGFNRGVFWVGGGEYLEGGGSGRSTSTRDSLYYESEAAWVTLDILTLLLKKNHNNKKMHLLNVPS